MPSRTPWATGVVVSIFAAMLSTVAVAAFSEGLANVNAVLAIVVNIVAVGGLAPTVWRWRAVPVWRWVVYGAVVGIPLGWIAAIAA
ncbi:DUF2537 domain-containing protein [Rhodococcus sp. IEGM 1379]|uniref:DUF2537 domain-containing protein n=1 Tax=Rhodococcus sp. IEGM 1379 TaxID=3047086 RepID=UPI0024B80301|nr:DUF2537 domain-containing protein [Rhodococcus sp. IEGM 1379]MDI9914859.1 DUF2537 domain-containing protein [Rhodococcus sp. IEGM 1379]